MRKPAVRRGLVVAVVSTLPWGCDGSATAPGSPADDGGPQAGGAGPSEHRPQGGATSSGASGAAGASGCAEVDPGLAERDAAELFGADSVPTFDVFLPEQAWEDLKVHARDEQYVEATACFEGQGLGTIGLRFKGSYGSLYSCFDESGQNTCRKLSMKLKFSEYASDQRFFGMKRLNLQGNRYDQTHLRERLAFDLYRAMGIRAPRAAWANVRVNGQLQGLFCMVEQIDGRFTDDRWPDNGDQNLYKETWPISTDESWLLGQLKTNEDEGDVSALAAFGEAMNAADEADLRATLGKYVDLDYWARYMAVDDAIINNDGVTAYYTSEDDLWSGNHNFYLYQEAPDHFTILPWDLESTLNRGAGFGSVPRWTEVPEDCSERYGAWGGDNLVIAPGCDRVFRALAEDLTTYRTAGQELLDGPFGEQTLIDAIDTYAARIRGSVQVDPNGPTVTTFDQEVDYLKKQIPGLRSRFERVLSGEPWIAIELSTTALNDFEIYDDFSLTEGTWLGANEASSVAVTINDETPIGGQQDLKMSFEYFDQPGAAWEQWSAYRIPLAGGITDVRELTGIRMWVRADSPRGLRFNIDSNESSGASEGIRFGWDLSVTETATQVEVLFADAALADWVIDQGRDPGDPIEDILATLNAVVVQPECVGVGITGLLGDGVSDAGFVVIDDLEFF
jgi:hypothetical protein